MTPCGRCFGSDSTLPAVTPITEETKSIWRGTLLVHRSLAQWLRPNWKLASSLPWLPASYAKPGPSGKRHADLDVRIVDENDQKFAANTAGENSRSGPFGRIIMFQGLLASALKKTLKLMRNMCGSTPVTFASLRDGFFFVLLIAKKDYLRRRGEKIFPVLRWISFLPCTGHLKVAYTRVALGQG